MRHLSPITRSTLFALAAATLTAGAVAPVQAKKAPSITVPATVFKDPSSKLCLPGNIVPGADRNAKTLCQTRDEWTAQGVAIIVK